MPKIIKRNWPEAIEAENGLKFIIVKKGKGNKPETGTKLKVVYTGQFLDGRQFSSSAEEGNPWPQEKPNHSCTKRGKAA